MFWYHLVSSFTTTATPPITHTGPVRFGAGLVLPQDPLVRLWPELPRHGPHRMQRVSFCIYLWLEQNPRKKIKLKDEHGT